MNICINTNVTPSGATGVGQYIEGLCSGLVKFSPEINLNLLIDKANPNILQLPTCKLSGLPFRAENSYLHLFYQPLVMRMLKHQGADLYHLPNTSPLLYKVCPTVYSIMDLQEFFIDKYGRARGLYRKVINWFGAHLSDAVITISEHSRKTIIQNLRIKPEKVHTVPLGCDPSFRLLEHVDDLEVSKPYIISVGQLQPGKNYLRLLDAFAKSSVVHTHKLVIVGSKGWSYQPILERAMQSDLKDQVVFLHNVNKSHLVTLYNQAEISIIPSLYEGFGIPALEAMSCGVPVLASNNSSLPEVLGDAGRYFNPYDVKEMTNCLDETIGSPGMRTTMRERGLIRTKEFSWEKTAQETLKIYRSVL